MGPIANLIGKILGSGKVLDVISEAIPDVDKKREFEHNFKMAVLEKESEFTKTIVDDLKSSRELAGIEFREIKGKFIDFLRALPRPLLALIAGFIWAYSIFQRIDSTVPHLELTYFDYSIIGAVIGFYFGFRWLDKKNGKMGGGF